MKYLKAARCIGLAIGFAIAAAMGTDRAAGQELIVAGERIADAQLLAAAKKDGQLAVYSAFPRPSYELIRRAFEADTGIRVAAVNLVADKLFARATAEWSAKRLEADYVDLTDLTLTLQLVERGLLNRPYKVPDFDRLPTNLRDANGRWYAGLRNVSAVGVNSAIVLETAYPKSWKDVLDPRWKGKIGIQSIDVGGSAFTLQSFLREQVDGDYWRKLAGQKPRIYAAALPAINDLVRGETEMVLASPASLLEQARTGAPVKVVFPVEGISAFAIAGGITTLARRPNAAMLYLNWLTSRRGSAVVATANVYGLHPEAPVPSPPGVTFPPESKLWMMDVDRWIALRESYSTEWRAIFGVK
jgi:iron(III) transport system substrate-binding protein